MKTRRGILILAGCLIFLCFGPIPTLANDEYPPNADARQLRQAMLFVLMGQPGLAERAVRDVLQEQTSRDDVRGQAESSWVLAAIRDRRGAPRDAIELYEQSARLARRSGDPLATWLPLYGKAELQRYLLDHAAAEDTYRESLAELAVLRDRVEAGEPLRLDAWKTLAAAFGVSREDLENMLAVLPPDQILDQPEVLSLCGLVDSLSTRGELREAEELLRKAEDQARALGILTSQVSRRLGEIALARGDVREAEKRFEEALGETDALVDLLARSAPVPKPLLDVLTMPFVRADEALILLDLGRLEQQRSRFDDAERYLLEARTRVERVGNQEMQALIDWELVLVDISRGIADSARERLASIRSLATEKDLEPLKVRSALGLARAEFLDGNWQLARQGLDAALASARSHSLAYDELVLLREQGYVHAAVQRLEQADALFGELEALAGASRFRGLWAEARLLRGLIALYPSGPSDPSSLGMRPNFARDACRDALDVSREMGAQRVELMARLCEVVRLAVLERHADALPILDEVIRRARILGDSGTEAEGRFMQALALIRLGRDQEAYKAFHDAETLPGSQYRTLLAQVGRGHTALSLGRCAEGLEALEQSAEWLGEGTLRAPQSDRFLMPFEALLPSSVHGRLVDLYVKQGDVEAAFCHAERARAQILQNQRPDKP